MKLNPPKKNTFWAAVVLAAVGVVIYTVHVFLGSVRLLGGAGFLVLLAAFVLLGLGLTLKGL